MPTFVFFKNSQKVESLRGADPKRLEQMIVSLGGSLFDMVSSCLEIVFFPND